jgi:hypothetical protein
MCPQANFADDDPLLLEAYAFGEILDPDVDDLEAVRVALVLNLPADEVTWWAFPQVCTALVSMLRLDRVPVRAFWRPAVWPVWNHVIRRPLCFWTHDGDTNEGALAALSTGDTEGLRLPEPTPEEETEQLLNELDASLAHLRRVEESYDDRTWRRAHKGSGVFPEDHLWRAVHGYLDLLDAIRTTGS